MITGESMTDTEWLEAVLEYEGDTRLDLLADGPERVQRLLARVAELEGSVERLIAACREYRDMVKRLEDGETP